MVDEKSVLDAIKQAKESSKKRNFTQTYDLIVNIKDLDIKNQENHVELFVSLHYSKGRSTKVCALVGPELKSEAEKVCEKTVLQHEFAQYSGDKKKIKNLASEYDYFIAQANIMPQVATAFGKVLGPKKKMPNPKAGCVVPPNANLKPLHERLQQTVKVSVKERLVVQVPVGSEKMEDKEVADNILTIYNQLVHHLPLEKNNIKNVFVKLTMGKPIPIK